MKEEVTRTGGDRDFHSRGGRGRGGRGGYRDRERGDRDYGDRGRDEGYHGRGGRGRPRDREDFDEGKFDRRPKRRFEDNQYGTLVKPGSGANDKDNTEPKSRKEEVDPIEEYRRRKDEDEKFDKKISKRGPRSGDFEEAESLSREKKKRADPIPLGSLTRGDKPSIKTEPKSYVPPGNYNSNKFGKDRDDFDGNSNAIRKDSKSFKGGDWQDSRGPKKEYVPSRGRGGFKNDNFRKPSDWEDRSGGHKSSYHQDEEKPKDNLRDGFRKNSGFGDRDRDRGDFE